MHRINILILLLILNLTSCNLKKYEVIIEAESFTDKGGWVVDTLKIYAPLNMNVSKLSTLLVSIISSFIIINGCNTKIKNYGKNVVQLNTLTRAEKKEGWELLFDGKTFNGWRGFGREGIPAGYWKIENGAIRKVNNNEVPSMIDGKPSQSGDLISVKTFDNFELYFEWKITKAGNTGVKYNVTEEMSLKYGSKYSAIGFEYQLLDNSDERYKNKLKPSQYTGSLYDLIPASNISLTPPGEFNSSSIIVDGKHCEHWLNGVKVVEYEFGSALLDSVYLKSKFRKYQDFIEKRKGHIVLQNHKDDAWFRNIKIREISIK